MPCASDVCETYDSASLASYVLEVNAGWAKKHGTKVGDTIILNF